MFVKNNPLIKDLSIISSLLNDECVKTLKNYP